MELAELALKNTIFEFSDKTYKQIHGTVIGTTFAPPYAILLEEKILSKVKKELSVRWRYINNIFYLGTW